jgi:hypothetical protein
LVKSPPPLFVKEGFPLHLKKGDREGFSGNVLTIMRPLIYPDRQEGFNPQVPEGGLSGLLTALHQMS